MRKNMREDQIWRKLLLPILLMAVVTSGYSFETFALIEFGKEVQKNTVHNVLINQQPSGVLLIIRGQVKINSSPASIGLTVLSNSTIVTHLGGDAILDLGSLGLIWIRENTEVHLTFTSAIVQMKSLCDGTRIEVRQGQVEVKLPKKEMLNVYESKTYMGSAEILTRGNTNFIVDCSGRVSSINISRRSAGGFFALIAVGVASNLSTEEVTAIGPSVTGSLSPVIP